MRPVRRRLHRAAGLVAGCVLVGALTAGLACRAEGPGKAAAPPGKAARAPEVSPELRPYLEAGFPPPDRVWMSNDYHAWIEGSRTISSSRPLPRPMMGQGPAAPLFARLISDENLKNLESPDRPVAENLENAAGMLDAFYTIRNAYHAELGESDRKYSQELWEVYYFIFKLQGVTFRLLEKRGLAPGPPVRFPPEALKKAVPGDLFTSCKCVLRQMTWTSMHRAEDLERFARRLPGVLTPVWGKLDPARQAELLDDMEKVVKGKTTPAIRKAIGALREALPKPAGPVAPAADGP